MMAHWLQWIAAWLVVVAVLVVGAGVQEYLIWRKGRTMTGEDKMTAALWKILIVGVIIIVAIGALAVRAFAREDGRYAQSPLKQWFDGLKSGKGPCCSDADGYAVSDPDWETKGGHYRVRLEGDWIDVPDDAVITEPNRAGKTMVWPMFQNGRAQIRCFMPGSMI
jgi:hypothetical protein